MRFGTRLLAATLAWAGLALPANAADLMWWTGVFGDQPGCAAYFNEAERAGVFVDRAGVMGREWGCDWQSVRDGDAGDSDFFVFEVTAICFAEGDEYEVSGQVSLAGDFSSLFLEMPEVYPETEFPSCR
ncbi:MAG: hypothetical protein AAFX39_06755 [Pseudomonadota bacterium]